MTHGTFGLVLALATLGFGGVLAAPQAAPDIEQARAGGHGGADTSIQDLIFRGSPGSDPLNLRAGLRAGALSSLIGIAARHSIERGSQMVKINDLVQM